MISVIRPEDGIDPPSPLSGAPGESNFSTHTALSLPPSPQGGAHCQQQPPQGWGFRILERIRFVNPMGLLEERIVVQDWVPNQTNALEQVGVVTEALSHTARFVEALAEETLAAVGEIRQVLQAQRDEVQEHIAGVYHAGTDLGSIVNDHTVSINAVEAAVNQCSLDLRAVSDMATATQKLANELRLESDNAYHHIQELLAKKDTCDKVKKELDEGVDELQKNCIRLDGDLKSIKTMLDRKENFVTIEKHNQDLVQLEEANKNLITGTSQDWKEEHDRILQTLASNVDTKIQAAEEGRARLKKAQRETTQGFRGNITQPSASIQDVRINVNTMKEEIRTLRQVKVEFLPEGPDPDQVKELVGLMNTMQDQLSAVTREYHDLKLANASLQTQKDQLETELEVITTKCEANEAVLTTLDDIVEKKIKEALKLVGPNSESLRLPPTSSSSSMDSLKREVEILNREVERLKTTEKNHDRDLLILAQRADELDNHVGTVSRMAMGNARKLDSMDLGGPRPTPATRPPPTTPYMAPPVEPTDILGGPRRSVVYGLRNGGPRGAGHDPYDAKKNHNPHGLYCHEVSKEQADQIMPHHHPYRPKPTHGNPVHPYGHLGIRGHNVPPMARGPELRGYGLPSPVLEPDLSSYGKASLPGFDQDDYVRRDRPEVHDGRPLHGETGDWSHLKGVDMRFINPDDGSFDTTRVWKLGVNHPNSPLPKVKPTGMTRGLAFGDVRDYDKDHPDPPMGVDQALVSGIEKPWSERPGPGVHGPLRTPFVDEKAMVFMQNNSAVPVWDGSGEPSVRHLKKYHKWDKGIGRALGEYQRTHTLVFSLPQKRRDVHLERWTTRNLSYWQMYGAIKREIRAEANQDILKTEYESVRLPDPFTPLEYCDTFAEFCQKGSRIVGGITQEQARDQWMLILSFTKKGQNLVSDVFKEQEKKGTEFNYVQVFLFGTPSIFALWKSKIRMDQLIKRARMYANMHKGVHQLQGAAEEKSTQDQPSTSQSDTAATEEAEVDALKCQGTVQPKGKGKMKCTKCGSDKHNADQCWKAHPELAPAHIRDAIINAEKKKDQKGQGHGRDQGKKKEPCPGCGRTGHTADQCYVLHPELKEKRNKK